MFGSNFQPVTNLRAALAKLREQCAVVAISSVYQSPAVGEAGGEPYLNFAVEARATGTPDAFKLALREIEASLGRRRDAGSIPGQVPVDLDIALWGTTPVTYGAKPWRSPSPDILAYAFVALPLAELAPDLRHPETGERLRDIAARFAAEPIVNRGRLFG